MLKKNENLVGVYTPREEVDVIEEPLIVITEDLKKETVGIDLIIKLNNLCVETANDLGLKGIRVDSVGYNLTEGILSVGFKTSQVSDYYVYEPIKDAELN